MQFSRRALFAQALAAKPARNVLLIVADDLNTDLGCYGHPLVRTPHLDRLARQGVRFSRAYCNYPVCNPSRTSFLSGRYPEQTQVLDNRLNPRHALPDAPFLPAYFRARGYHTASIGKIYHDGMASAADWDIALNPQGSARIEQGEGRNLTGGRFPYFQWVASEAPEEEHPDARSAAEAIRLLGESRTQPFLLAVGFRKPHDRYVAPKSYFDLYPPDRIPPAVGPADDAADIPPLAYPQEDLKLGAKEAMEFRRAYWACVSFMDAQVGKVLDALDRSPHAGNTLVIFTSDHGLHLGEHDWWNKVALWERTTRVPFIARSPGLSDPGRTCESIVELVDLFPTLTAWSGLPTPAGLPGRSFLPALTDPNARWERSAYTMVTRRGGKLGRALRTSRYRYIEWDGGRAGRELYDHASDPGELTNLADNPEYAGRLQGLRTELSRRP